MKKSSANVATHTGKLMWGTNDPFDQGVQFQEQSCTQLALSFLVPSDGIDYVEFGFLTHLKMPGYRQDLVS